MDTEVWINGEGDYSELHRRADGRAWRVKPGTNQQISLDHLTGEQVNQIILDENMSLRTT